RRVHIIGARMQDCAVAQKLDVTDTKVHIQVDARTVGRCAERGDRLPVERGKGVPLLYRLLDGLGKEIALLTPCSIGKHRDGRSGGALTMAAPAVVEPSVKQAQQVGTLSEDEVVHLAGADDSTRAARERRSQAQ